MLMLASLCWQRPYQPGHNDLNENPAIGYRVGDQVTDAVDVLPASINTEQACLQEYTPLTLGDLSPYDHVDWPVLVFECDEGDAACGLGPLALRHQAGGAHMAGMRLRT